MGGMPKHHYENRMPVESLITILGEVPDPRLDRSKDHELTDILAIALCTILVGGESFYDME
ncbi:MAG: transposase family protein, partial [Verrucomicrobiota bacterium]